MQIIEHDESQLLRLLNGIEYKVKSVEDKSDVGEVRVTLDLTDEQKNDLQDEVLNTPETFVHNGFSSSATRIKTNKDGDKVFIFTGVKMDVSSK